MTTMTTAAEPMATPPGAPTIEMRTLHETYGTRAHALAYRITRDRELAADAVQEALLAAWRTRSSYDPARGTLSAWFFTMVHHRAVDQVRRATPQARAFEFEEAERLPAQATGPEEHAVRADQARRVRAEVNRLTAIQRQAVALAYYNGYTQTQVAQLLNLPLGTVKARTHSAIVRLRATVSLEPFRTGVTTTRG